MNAEDVEDEFNVTRCTNILRVIIDLFDDALSCEQNVMLHTDSQDHPSFLFCEDLPGVGVPDYSQCSLSGIPTSGPFNYPGAGIIVSCS